MYSAYTATSVPCISTTPGCRFVTDPAAVLPHLFELLRDTVSSFAKCGVVHSDANHVHTNLAMRQNKWQPLILVAHV